MRERSEGLKLRVRDLCALQVKRRQVLELRKYLETILGDGRVGQIEHGKMLEFCEVFQNGIRGPTIITSNPVDLFQASDRRQPPQAGFRQINLNFRDVLEFPERCQADAGDSAAAKIERRQPCERRKFFKPASVTCVSPRLSSVRPSRSRMSLRPSSVTVSLKRSSFVSFFRFRSSLRPLPVTPVSLISRSASS